MSKKRTAEETRELIFKSCGTILSTEGAKSLTLEAVAREAGLSKGGLLYHFPTKEELVEALFKYYLDKFEAQIEEMVAANPTENWLTAYMLASIDQIIDPDTASLFASLFAAGDEFPGVLDTMRQSYVTWQQRVEASGLDPVLATLIRLTVDGLWFSEMYQYAPPNPERRAQIVALVKQMIATNHAHPVDE